MRVYDPYGWGMGDGRWEMGTGGRLPPSQILVGRTAGWDISRCHPPGMQHGKPHTLQ